MNRMLLFVAKREIFHLIVYLQYVLLFIKSHKQEHVSRDEEYSEKAYNSSRFKSMRAKFNGIISIRIGERHCTFFVYFHLLNYALYSLRFGKGKKACNMKLCSSTYMR
jgi:hypothetical protein